MKTRYRRIYKKEAVSRFKVGEDVYMLSSKVSSDNAFQRPVKMRLDTSAEARKVVEQFERQATCYRYYNCDSERGLTVRFYVAE